MKFETFESGLNKKRKKARISGVTVQFTAKEGGKITKPTLIIDSPDAEIPPLKLTPEVARDLSVMLNDYLEDLKAAEWDGDWRVHGDWEDLPSDRRLFGPDDDW